MYLGCANTCEDIALLYNQYKIEKTERITNWTGRKWVPAVFFGIFSGVANPLYTGPADGFHRKGRVKTLDISDYGHLGNGISSGIFSRSV
ncbi:MAG: hypothetical protein ACI9WL_001120 [Rubritalea sp.]|jgi:hypothetical protein